MMKLVLAQDCQLLSPTVLSP